MRSAAAFLHHYPGYTWETMMAMPTSRWRVLLREASRQCADEGHRQLVIAHSSDVKDLEERLRYAAHPELAYWTQPRTPDAVIEATLATIRRP